VVVFPDEEARIDWDYEMLMDCLGVVVPLKTDEIEMWDVDMLDLS
jgi:hypothetical protein